jgi:hypothetical protein
MWKVMRWGSTSMEDEVLYGDLMTVSGAVASGEDDNGGK